MASDQWSVISKMTSVVPALLSAYLLGSIPTAYLLVKWTKRIDIRSVGSGNVGATNALRSAGPWAGAVVLGIDIAKGLLAIAVIPRWLLEFPSPHLALACGLAAVLGHVFPCFLRFRGGKGVATTLGVLLGYSPIVGGLVIGVWGVVFAASRYVSLASLAAAIAIPLIQLARHRAADELLIGTLLAGLITVRHKDNLQRLLSGTEHRAWSAKS